MLLVAILCPASLYQRRRKKKTKLLNDGDLKMAASDHHNPLGRFNADTILISAALLVDPPSINPLILIGLAGLLTTSA